MAAPVTQVVRKSPQLEPFVVEPALSHQQTFIILHGRGSKALEFGPELLCNTVSGAGTLKETFPHAKFVFPTAPASRATIYKKSIIHQWFDNWHLSQVNERTELMIPGLKRSVTLVHELLAKEIALVGIENVVLGGLSQGCATSLIVTLTWPGPPLQAVFGMCGWLPFRAQLDETFSWDAGEATPNHHDDENSFSDGADEVVASKESANDTSGPSDPLGLLGRDALEYYCTMLDMEDKLSKTSQLPPFQETAFFLGHGVEDERVPLKLGQEAAICLKSFTREVIWKEYNGLGHWYSAEMLADLVAFLSKFHKKEWICTTDCTSRLLHSPRRPSTGLACSCRESTPAVADTCAAIAQTRILARPDSLGVSGQQV